MIPIRAILNTLPAKLAKSKRTLRVWRKATRHMSRTDRAFARVKLDAELRQQRWDIINPSVHLNTFSRTRPKLTAFFATGMDAALGSRETPAAGALTT